MKKILLSLLLLIPALAAFAAAPQVLNVMANPQRGKVVITYDLISVEAYCNVSLEISNDNGATFSIIPVSVTGDIGTQISPGINKEILWYPGLDAISEGENYVAKVIAEDVISMVSVAGGSFHNGVSQVTLSSFLIDKYECTQEEFEALMGFNPAQLYGVGSDLPVHQVTWYMTVKYCNLRSLQEGLLPCYTYANTSMDYGSNPSDWPASLEDKYFSCNWEANGYRLPTEAEWEFAARGGNMSNGFLYSGSNVCGDVAWYSGNGRSTVHPVGSKAPNELGIYDMSGNAWEWCWDNYGAYPSEPQTNPKGANRYSTKVQRGGAANTTDFQCASSFRANTIPFNASYYMGFRCVRKAP